MTPYDVVRLEKKIDDLVDKVDKIESYIDRQKGGAGWAVMILTSVGALGAFIYYLTSSVHLWFTSTVH